MKLIKIIVLTILFPFTIGYALLKVMYLMVKLSLHVVVVAPVKFAIAAHSAKK